MSVQRYRDSDKFSSNSARIRLSILAYYPMAFQSSLFRALAVRRDIDLQVLYLWGRGCTRSHYNDGFDRWVETDPSLLEGYDFSEVDNWALQAKFGEFTGILNPTMPLHLWRFRPHALLVGGWNYASHVFGLAYTKATGCALGIRTDTNGVTDSPRKGRIVRDLWLEHFVSSCSSVFYVGSANRRFYRKMGVPEEQLHFSPFAVDNDRIAAEAVAQEQSAQELRRRFGARPGRPLIAFVGKLSARKGPRLLLEAAKPILKARQAALLFVGDGPERASLEACVEREGIPGVHFEGFIPNEQLAAYYTASDIFCLLSSWEPYGLAVNEALVCGNAVVVSDRVGAAADLVIDGENGYVVSFDDAVAVRLALERMVDSQSLLRSMQVRSRELVSDWSQDEAARGIADGFRHALAKRG